MTSPLDDTRRAELVTALGGVRAHIADACAAAGRDVRTVTLVAVTKTYPASDVATLAELGVLDIGESRDQEAAAKVGETAELLARHLPPDRIPALRWHFIGRVQTRKARSIARYAAAVHSVDRPEVVAAMADGVARVDRAPLEVFVQVSLDGDPDRGGALVDAVPALADQVAGAEGLVLRGVMAVPPVGADPDAAFEQLARVATQVRADHPEADAISAGMSADLDAALRHGSTHVRVGTALLGRRPPPIG